MVRIRNSDDDMADLFKLADLARQSSKPSKMVTRKAAAAAARITAKQSRKLLNGIEKKTSKSSLTLYSSTHGSSESHGLDIGQTKDINNVKSKVENLLPVSKTGNSCDERLVDFGGRIKVFSCWNVRPGSYPSGEGGRRLVLNGRISAAPCSTGHKPRSDSGAHGCDAGGNVVIDKQLRSEDLVVESRKQYCLRSGSRLGKREEDNSAIAASADTREDPSQSSCSGDVHPRYNMRKRKFREVQYSETTDASPESLGEDSSNFESTSSRRLRRNPRRGIIKKHAKVEEPEEDEEEEEDDDDDEEEEELEEEEGGGEEEMQQHLNVRQIEEMDASLALALQQEEYEQQRRSRPISPPRRPRTEPSWINGMNLLRLQQRDLNENDYEMLLALDENNVRIGASASQIKMLRLSKVMSGSKEEPCSICLEKPSVGDAIRHLPCLHKYHEKCIIEWLKSKTSCPICKSVLPEPRGIPKSKKQL